MENQNKFQQFKDRFVQQVKETSHIEKLYIGIVAFILVAGYANFNAGPQNMVLLSILIIGAVLLFRQKPTGWHLLFIHVFLFTLPLFLDLVDDGFRFFKYKKFLQIVVTFLSFALLALLLLKPIRKRFDILSREIVVCIVGALMLMFIPKLFNGVFQYEAKGVAPIVVYVFLLIAILQFLRKHPPLTYSNWNTYLEGLTGISSDEYYQQLQEKLESKNVEGISYTRVMLSKRGMLSSRREYLRISFEDVAHDISFYPFALGTYASSWSYQTLTGGELLVASIPYIGLWLHKKFYPETYYIMDARKMMQLLIHETQLEIIDGYTTQKGLRKLSEQQRQLQTRSVFDR